jgi:hypothetical protein
VVVIQRASAVAPPSTAAESVIAAPAPTLVALAPAGAAPLAAPVVTTQPGDQTVAAGSVVTLVAAASGNPAPSVSWQSSADGGATWSDTSPSFVAQALLDGRLYRAIFRNSQASATSTVARLTVTPFSTSSFSGYIAFAPPGESFTAVRATWVVPTVTCQAGQDSFGAQWPGIGANTSVEQAGTETNCENGVPTYYAWYDMYGDPGVSPNGYAIALPRASYPLAPGDTVTASISIAGSTWELALSDSTAGWSWAQSIASPNPPLDQSSAEWMVEDPALACAPGCPPPALSNITPVTFTGASATGEGGLSGPISALSGLGAMQIASAGSVLAAPGPLNAAGDGFTVTAAP